MSANPTQEKPTDTRNDSPVTPALNGDADDDSFDANEYVRQLIARMDGEEPTSAIPEVKPAPAPQTKQPAPRQSTRRFRDPRSPEARTEPTSRPQPTDSAKATPSVPTSAVKSTPRTTREEQFGVRSETASRSTQEVNVDLEKLREAVNLTTSNALRTFDCSNLLRRAFLELFAATFAIALATILASMSSTAFSLAHVFSIILLGFGFFVTWRYWRTTAVLWKHAKQNRAAAQSK